MAFTLQHSLEEYVCRVAAHFHVEKEDALQELELWKLECERFNRKQDLNVLYSRIRALASNTYVSGTKVVFLNTTPLEAMHERIPGPIEVEDHSVKITEQAIRYWRYTGVITSFQALLIYAHVVEEIPLKRILEYEDCSYSYLCGQYQKAKHAILAATITNESATIAVNH